ncbi:MAG: hypothetical protein IKS55_02515 [Oscillospiraceae bacterium]|nr:hypothetical protein [Oscillospiraceae bacterium]
MNTQIVTLCDACRRQYEEGFHVKPYPGKPTTEKRASCEQCRRRLRADCLKQYIVTAKGGRK